jgi:hypothetical protein
MRLFASCGCATAGASRVTSAAPVCRGLEASPTRSNVLRTYQSIDIGMIPAKLCPDEILRCAQNDISFCHPERSEGSRPDEILRCAENDRERKAQSDK